MPRIYNENKSQNTVKSKTRNEGDDSLQMGSKRTGNALRRYWELKIYSEYSLAWGKMRVFNFVKRIVP